MDTDLNKQLEDIQKQIYKFMKTTELTIKVIIEHDTDNCKDVAIDTFCNGLKKGLKIKGINGLGEKYKLKVTEVTETTVK